MDWFAIYKHKITAISPLTKYHTTGGPNPDFRLENQTPGPSVTITRARGGWLASIIVEIPGQAGCEG